MRLLSDCSGSSRDRLRLRAIETAVHDEPQIFLDPLNPQSEMSDVVLDVFTKLVESEPSVRERFVRHYEMWKTVVDNPEHPDHSKVRSKNHDDLTFPPNMRCSCRSGRKFKNCCGRASATDGAR